MQLRTPFYLALRLFGMMSRLVSQLTLLARNFTAYRSALQIYKTVIHYRLFGASVTLAMILVHQNVTFKLNSCPLILREKDKRQLRTLLQSRTLCTTSRGPPSRYFKKFHRLSSLFHINLLHCLANVSL